MSQPAAAVRQSEEALRLSYARDVRSAFSTRPWNIPTKYLYNGKGSRFFQEFTASSPEYYPHAEERLIASYSDPLRRILDVDQIIELGAGACPQLSQLLELGLIPDGSEYRALDVSASPMLENLGTLCSRFPQLNAKPCIGDFETWDVQEYADTRATTTILWLGNTAANCTPRQFGATLARLATAFQKKPAILLGMDLGGECSDVHKRFPDQNGAFSRFRWNALARLNETFEGDFQPQNFRLELSYNHSLGQAESVFVPLSTHSVQLKELSLSIDFDLTDRLIIGTTKDYTADALRGLLSASGWSVKNVFVLPASSYALVHAIQPTSSPAAIGGSSDDSR